MKIDSLKEKHNRYKELFKALIYLLLALLTGLSTIVYQILTHKILPHMIVLVGIGLVIGFLLLSFGKIIWIKMQDIEKEMENV